VIFATTEKNARAGSANGNFARSPFSRSLTSFDLPPRIEALRYSTTGAASQDVTVYPRPSRGKVPGEIDDDWGRPLGGKLAVNVAAIRLETDVRLRLKGISRNFHSRTPARAFFSVVAKITDADLRYADGWPQASGISGDLIFEGKSMRVAASKASVSASRQAACAPSIPICFTDAHVEVEVRAEDQTSDSCGSSPRAR